MCACHVRAEGWGNQSVVPVHICAFSEKREVPMGREIQAKHPACSCITGNG